ncbi:ras-associated and pleckstrin homology domains-containing protein 1a isoform X2 [Stigmatopora nigra]
MDQLSDEEVEVREGEEEEDSDKEDQDLDKIFGAWLGELDKLTQSLDDGRPERPLQQKAPLRQETNMANFSYRFSICNINEALNQGENADLDALMADLSSIEQELSTVNSKQNSSVARLGLTDTKVCQKPPAGPKGRKQSAGGSVDSSRGNGVTCGGGSGASSSCSSTKASPASTIRITQGQQERRGLSSNFSLDDITSQLEKASMSIDEAAHQSSSHSLGSTSTMSATLRWPESSQEQHRRTGSVGTVSDHEERSVVNSSRSSTTSASAISVNSASSMDSLDNVPHDSSSDSHSALPPYAANGAGQSQNSTEHSYLDRETSLILRNIAGKPSHLLTKEEQSAKLKADNIRIALEKIKEAQVKKLVIRVHLSDESSKTMMVDERQTVRQVLDNLLEKSHCGYSPDWSLVETINDLQIERVFEDHENLVENLLNWTRDSQNRLMFTERIEKYALFKNPQECFGGNSVSVPEMEGVLWLKEDGKKSWKKRYFLLRASGIYYVPKGKAKSSRDLACFLQLDHVNVFHGQDFKSKYKAPTDFCMVLKHPQIQKKSQYIKYICCEDVRTLHQWINSIRIAKYGKQLYINFQESMRRTETTYERSSISSSSIRSGSSSSSLPGTNIPQPEIPGRAAQTRDDQQRAPISKDMHESQSNHSSQSDIGVSDMMSSSQARSQSVVSSIFSDAWRRGTQGEMMKMDVISRPIPLQIPTVSSQHPALSQTPAFPSSYTGGTDSSSPLPAVDCEGQQAVSTAAYVKYSTLARLQNQNQLRAQPASVAVPHNYNTLPTAYCATPPPPPSTPPPLPPTDPVAGSAMVVLKYGLPSTSAITSPPSENEFQELLCLTPPPPEILKNTALPRPCNPKGDQHVQLTNAGLQEFLAHKFPNMVYDFTPAMCKDSFQPPPAAEFSPPASMRPLSPNASSPLPPKTFTGGFPPHTAQKPASPSSLPLALSPVSPTLSPGSHAPVKKQQSFSTGHSPNQPPPTLPKQHSLSSKNLVLCPPSSSSVSVATLSLVKQIVNQFPGNTSNSPLASSNSMEGSKSIVPQSPPAVKTKPKWPPGGTVPPHSPEFPPPPPDNSLKEFLPPPKTASPIKKSPSSLSACSIKRNPPSTPQRASSVRSNSGELPDERPTKVESLLSKFGQAPQTATSSSSSSATSSPCKEMVLPTPLPKPGKLNLANLPLALQGLQMGQNQQFSSDFPSPPPPPPLFQPQHLDSSPDYFPPPPSDSELFPPLHLSDFHQPPKVAVVNPQPQQQAPAPLSSWKQGSLQKGPLSPSNPRTSNSIPYETTTSLPLSPPPLSQTPPPTLSPYSSSPVPHTSPKPTGPSTLALKTHFLEDLNRTLKRKSVSRHGSLTSSHLIPSSKMEPIATMDDMALLPPPPPELLQQQQVSHGHTQTLSRHHAHSQSGKISSNISGYATLRRGPPPAPPKRDQSTKLTSE